MRLNKHAHAIASLSWHLPLQERTMLALQRCVCCRVLGGASGATRCCRALPMACFAEGNLLGSKRFFLLGRERCLRRGEGQRCS